MWHKDPSGWVTSYLPSTLLEVWVYFSPAVSADLGALAGNRTIGGEDGHVFAGSQGAGARFADGVVLRAVRTLGAELRRDECRCCLDALGHSFCLAECLADKAGRFIVLGIGLVGIPEGGQRIDCQAHGKTGGTALGL